MSELAWKIDFIQSFQLCCSTEDKLKRLLDIILDEDVDPFKYSTVCLLFEQYIESFDGLTMARLLSPFLRDASNPIALSYSSHLICCKISADASELIYLTQACPQIVPYLLDSLMGTLTEPLLKLLTFLCSPERVSPYSKAEDLIIFLACLEDYSFPIQTGMLFCQLLKTIGEAEHSQITYCNLVVKKVLARLSIESSDTLLLHLLDSLVVFCKASEIDIVSLLLKISDYVPSKLASMFSTLLSLLVLNEPCSPIKQLKALKCAQSIHPLCFTAAVVMFYLGYSDKLDATVESPLQLDDAIVGSLESDELKVLMLVLSKNVPLPLLGSTPFMEALNLVLTTRKVALEPGYCTQFFTEISQPSADYLMRLFIWLFVKHTTQFKQLVQSLLAYGALDELKKEFALSSLTQLAVSPKIAFKLVPILCRNLSAYPFVFSLIQAYLPSMLHATSFPRQVTFALCAFRIVQADSRQGHLNFAFSCVRELFKLKSLSPDAAALALESLIRLCTIRYIDPKTVWKSIVEPKVSAMCNEHAVIPALTARLASLAILSHKLSYDEPVSDEVSELLNHILNTLFKTKEATILDISSKALLDLDPLYFGESYPTAQRLVEYLSTLQTSIPKDNAYFLLLKRALDKEISDMPRSLFLGTSTRSSATAVKTSEGLDTLAVLRRRVLSEWRMNPHLIESLLILKHHALLTSDDLPLEVVEQMLMDLLELPSLMSLHWSTRLSIMAPLMSYISLALSTLNSNGRMNKFLEKLFSLLATNMSSPASPTALATLLILRTGLELCRSEIVEDEQYKEWSKSLIMLTGRYMDSEEVEAATILCLNEISKSDADVMKALLNRLKTSSTWLSLLSSTVKSGVQPEAPGSSDLFQVISSNNTNLDMNQLAELAEMSTFTAEDARLAQILSAQASNAHSLDAAALDNFIRIHGKVVISEPVDLKNFVAFSISKAAAKLDPDVARVWLRHLIGKLEKPAPALLKADATIALDKLLFSSTDFLDLVSPAFFASTLPTLISATTDTRVCSWYILLMVKYLCLEAKSSSPLASKEATTDKRFASGFAFGMVLDTLCTTRSTSIRRNMIQALTVLKVLPRFNWTPILELIGDFCLDFVLAHLVSLLATGDAYISPSLLSFLRQGLEKFPFESLQLIIEGLPKVISHLESSLQSQLITGLLLRCADAREFKLPLFKACQEMFEADVEKPTDFDSMVVQLLPSELHNVVEYRALLHVAASILAVDNLPVSSLKACLELAALAKQDFDLKKLVSWLQHPEVYESPQCIEAAALELSALPKNLQPDLFIKILEVALIAPGLEAGLCRLVSLLIIFWIDEAHRKVFTSPHLHLFFVQKTELLPHQELSQNAVALAFKHFEASRMSHEEWRKARKRLAQLDPNTWKAFKSQII